MTTTGLGSSHKLLLERLMRARTALARDLLEQADRAPGPAACQRHASLGRHEVATQVAAAWLLGCVIVRMLEDRGLLERCLLVGPGTDELLAQFVGSPPLLSERDYLLLIFRALASNPWTRELFAPEHNLLWRIAPSAEGARDLLAVFREGSAECPPLSFAQSDTRFLGDLYQELNESIRKKDALVQTPDFISSFILDRTLTPALADFGLEEFTLCDPTCGTGHFLLDAFERLYQRWRSDRPSMSPREAAARAVGAVYGVDINPVCVAFARFRLVLAYAEKAAIGRLDAIPELPLHVIVADSLYHGGRRSVEQDETRPPSNARKGSHKAQLPSVAELKGCLEVLYKMAGLATRPSSFRRQLKGRVRDALVTEYHQRGQHDVAFAVRTAPLPESLLDYDPAREFPRYELARFAAGREVAVTTWGVPDEVSWEDPCWVDPVCAELLRALLTERIERAACL